MPLIRRRYDILNTPDVCHTRRPLLRSGERPPASIDCSHSVQRPKNWPLTQPRHGSPGGAVTRVETSLYSRLRGRTDNLHFIQSLKRLPQESPVFLGEAACWPFSEENGPLKGFGPTGSRYSRPAAHPIRSSAPPSRQQMTDPTRIAANRLALIIPFARDCERFRRLHRTRVIKLSSLRFANLPVQFLAGRSTQPD